ncbi:MAG: hypothetical protein QF815_03090, partial [Candidatus Peribacteraceae bacterium]|nr:hypothetical protein [Candidatus Peribacteraceae bacterium]
IAQLEKLPVYKYPKVEVGTIQLKDGIYLNIEKFLRISEPDTINVFSQKDITDILSVLHTQGRLREVREMFNRLNTECTKEKYARIEAVADTGSIQSMIEELRIVSRDSVEAVTIREKIRLQLASGSDRKDAEANSAASEMKTIRALIQHALGTITHLENAGHSVSALSNRASRAVKVGMPSKSLAELDATDAPKMECPITLDEDTSALMCRKMPNPDENTADFPLNFPLCTGDKNFVWICNGIVGITAAEQISTNPFTREPIDFIPIVKLTANNKDEVFKRLCNIFMGGHSMHHVWSIAIAAFVQTITTQEWAAPGTDMYECIVFMIREIMNTITAPGGSIVNPGETALLKDVIASAI